MTDTTVEQVKQGDWYVELWRGALEGLSRMEGEARRAATPDLEVVVRDLTRREARYRKNIMPEPYASRLRIAKAELDNRGLFPTT